MGRARWENLAAVVCILLSAAAATSQAGVQLHVTVFGRVLDTAGEPLADVEIRPLRLLEMELGEALTRSAADGTYRVELAVEEVGIHDPARATWLHFGSPGLASMAVRPMSPAPRLRRAVDVVLLPAAPTAGRVIDETGGGVAGARIVAGEAATFAWTAPFRRHGFDLPGEESLALAVATSGPRGHFWLPDTLQLGTRVRAWKPGWSSVCSDVIAPTTPVRLTLQPTGFVSGRVRPAGEGSPLGWVRSIDASGRMALARVGADGAFTLPRPSADRCAVTGHDPRRSHHGRFDTPKLDWFDGPRDDLEMALDPPKRSPWQQRAPGSGEIHGRIVSEQDEAPLPGLLVFATPGVAPGWLNWESWFAWFQTPLMTRADAAGRFRIGGLGAGHWVTWFMAPDERRIRLMQHVQLRAGERQADIELRYPQHAAQRGRVSGLRQPETAWLVMPGEYVDQLQPGDQVPPLRFHGSALGSAAGAVPVGGDGRFELGPTLDRRRPLAVLPRAAQLGGSPVAVAVVTKPDARFTDRPLVVDARRAQLGKVGGRVSLAGCRPSAGRLWVVAKHRASDAASERPSGYGSVVGPRTPVHQGRYELLLAPGPWTLELRDFTADVLLQRSAELHVPAGGEIAEDLEAACGTVRVAVPRFVGQQLEFQFPDGAPETWQFRHLSDLPERFGLILPIGRNTLARYASVPEPGDGMDFWDSPVRMVREVREFDVRAGKITEVSFLERRR